jgi:hypothetical protein
MKQGIGLFGGGAAVFILASCASISIQPDREYETKGRPEKIYVARFSAAQGEFNVDREKAELREFKANLQKIMQVAQVTDLGDRLIDAANAPRDPWSRPRRAWLVCGEFTRVNQGSRALRAIVGFGAGGTKLETRVEVYDLSDPQHHPFLTFATTGGSNAEPGAVTSIATDPLYFVIQAALSGASGFSHGLTEDTERTAREITAKLSDYMYQRNWIGADRYIKPKELDPGDKIE